jgi:hypothetical protein
LKYILVQSEVNVPKNESYSHCKKCKANKPRDDHVILN